MCSKKSYSEEQIAEMRALLPDYLVNCCGVRNLKRNFRCVIPSHRDSSPSAQYNESTQTVYCYGCGKAWDVFQLVGEVEGIERFPEQLERVAQLRGMQPEGEWEGVQKVRVQKPREYDKPEPITGPNVWEAVFECYTRIFEPEAIHALKYIHSRGFEDADIVAHGWGWCSHPSEIMRGFDKAPSGREGYICLPHPESASWDAVRFCTFRPLFACGKKELKPSGMPSALWREYLLTCGADAVGVCEGVFDAASFELLTGVRAVSLNGTGGASRLLGVLANAPKEKRPGSVLLCLDCDGAGRKASEGLLLDLRAMGVSASEFPPWPCGAKDTNEALCNALRGTVADGF